MVVLVRDIADQLLNQVLQSNQTGGSAVLINHNRHVRGLALHIAKQVHGALRLGFESGRAHDLHQGWHGGTLGGLGVQNVSAHRILQVEHAQNLVARIANHRHAGVARTQEQAQRLAQRYVATHGEHIGAGHHERADAQVVHLEHRLHHLRLVVLDGLGVGGSLQELAQLLFLEHASGGLCLAGRGDARREVIEQAGHGGQQLRQVMHRAGQHANRRNRAVAPRGARQHV